MPSATFNNGAGSLKTIRECYIEIPFADTWHTVPMYSLPDITDSKATAYNDEPIIGRSFPLKTYSHSENRAITFTLHFFTHKPNDANDNLAHLRAIQSALYPRTDIKSGVPFVPPPVCRIKCGSLLGSEKLNVVLKQYSVKFPTDVPWDEVTYTPIKFDVDTTWEVVYKTSDLPGQNNILFGKSRDQDRSQDALDASQDVLDIISNAFGGQ